MLNIKAKTMMRQVLLALALAMALSHAACGADNSTTGASSPDPPARAPLKEADGMKIRLKVGDTVLTATLIDSATARDFVSLLPLT